MRVFQTVLAIIVYISATAISASQEMQKENVEKVDIGKHEFELNCTICHGLQGRGDGPYAKMLTTQVPDLATLSQRNGGTFPFQRIYDIIDGTVMISAHGTKQMPIWGQVYTLKSEENYFTWRAFHWDDQPFVRARILALTEYVSRLQLKETDAK